MPVWFHTQEVKEMTETFLTPRIKVMLVDDHAMVRYGLRQVLEETGQFEVVGQAVDGVEAVAVAESLCPDVAVMDVMMPHKDGVEACREIMELLPGTRVLMLTASTEEDAVLEAVAAGATGYLQKYSGEEELLTAVRDVAEGRLRIPADIVRRVFASIRGEAGSAAWRGADALSTTEKETLALFASGKSYAQIAAIRGNSPTTTRNIIYRIQDKLGVATKQEIVVWAVRNGLLDDAKPSS